MFCTACAAPNLIATARCAVCGVGLVGVGPAPAATVRRPTPWRRRGRSIALPPPPALAPRHAPHRRGLLRVLYLLPVLALLATGGVAADRRRADRAELAGAYAVAAAAADAGRYQDAIAGFAAAAGFRDADARRAAADAALAPYRVAYENGLAAVDAGRFAEGVAALLPVARDQPEFGDVLARLGDARRRQADALRAEAKAAEARRDWPAAERALTALAAADPGDAAVAPRLATLRREHGPLVLARDHALYLVGPDGSDERLLTDAVPALWPVWSPDRSRVAFVSLDPAAGAEAGEQIDLYVVGADGAGLKRLAGDVAAHTAPVWSPDGSRIAYTSFAAFDHETDQGAIGVRVVDVASGRETDLTGSALPLAFNPAWSPSGDRIAFVAKQGPPGVAPTEAPGGVRVVTLATGATVDLTGNRLADAWSVAWSPTAERLVVFTLVGGNWYEPPRTELRPLDVATGEIGTVPTTSPHLGEPVWSPDGARFAFVDGEATVRVRSWDGDVATIEGEEKLGALTWAPDGGALLAGADDPRQPSTLITLDGSRAAVGEPAPVLGALPTTAVPLRFDYARPFYGPPQWAPLHPAPPAGPPSIAGTGLDHDGG